MGRRRGFFADIQHQAKLHERETARQEREADKRYRAAVREAERQRKAEERAIAQASRAVAKERKQLEREAKEAHVAAMESEVQRRNAELQKVEEELSTVLAATLDVDDFVDLETLRADATPPSFSCPEFETPIPEPVAVPTAPRPVLVVPDPPSGVFAFLATGKHKRALREAERSHERCVARWEAQVAAAETARAEQLATHASAEERRLARLAEAQSAYGKEAEEFVRKAEQQNAQLDQLIANLSYGVPEAVDEYLSIVLANSVYPEWLPVSHDFAYDAQTAELSLAVLIPPPGEMPSIQHHKYSKSADEIVPKDLTKKAQKDRYASVVGQVALRSLHEVFEADRRALIKSISLVVATETVQPATGNDARIPFTAVAAQREPFLKLNLGRVDVDATLRHLGASLSKNPFELRAADTSGIRKA